MRRRLFIVCFLFASSSFVRAASSDTATSAAGIVTEIRYIGIKSIPREELEPRVPVPKGRPLDMEKVVLGQGLLRSIYQNRGFWAVEVKTRVETVAPKQVVVTFIVDEGPLYRIGAIAVEGNQVLRTQLILDEFALKPGEEFSQTQVYEGHRRLFQTGYFDSIEVSFSSATAKTVNIALKVKERPTKFLKGSVGYGAELKERVSLGYEDRNFFGAMRKFDAKVTHSGFLTEPNKNQTTLVEVGLGWPRFLKTKWEFQNNISQEWRRHEAYSTRTTAWRTQIGQRFGPAILLNWRYRYEGTRLLSSSPEIAQTGGFTNISAVGPNLTYDNTDNVFLPNRGWRVNTLYEQGLRFGLGDLTFYKWQTKAGRFEPLIGHLIGFIGVQFGVMRPHDPDDIIPIFERYTLGGANSVRGYSERSLGPRDAQNDPVGGEAFLVGNLELRHPIYKIVQGVVFLDGGQLWGRETGTDWPHIRARGLSDFRYGTGLGIRLHTPLGAVRLEYGYQLNPEVPTKKVWDRSAIHVSLGEVF